VFPRSNPHGRTHACSERGRDKIGWGKCFAFALIIGGSIGRDFRLRWTMRGITMQVARVLHGNIDHAEIMRCGCVICNPVSGGCKLDDEKSVDIVFPRRDGRPAAATLPSIAGGGNGRPPYRSDFADRAGHNGLRGPNSISLSLLRRADL
jgi:hypothetical protein